MAPAKQSHVKHQNLVLYREIVLNKSYCNTSCPCDTIATDDHRIRGKKHDIYSYGKPIMITYSQEMLGEKQINAIMVTNSSLQ